MPMTLHAERGGKPRRLGADPADADDQRRRLGQVHDGVVLARRRLPFAAQLLRHVDLQAARKGQHEAHDVRGDVVVVDLAEIGDLHRVRDQLGIIIAGRRRRLRRLQPAQIAGALGSRSGGIVP